MISLQGKLQQVTEATGSKFHIVEKDYALSYVLAGIATVPELRKTLVFKGGTALKKCYFGDYRFSEDLDFSVIDAPKGDDLETLIKEALEAATDLLSKQGIFRMELERHVEKEPHPREQDAFDILVQFPKHRRPMCSLKVEVTHDEPVLLEPFERSIIHGYEETLEATIRCYQLEEIVSEKLRAMLQTRQKFFEKGSKRPRARDYYDLWKILTTYGETINKQTVSELLPQKCQHREVAYGAIEDFFTTELLTEVDTNWERMLGAYVKDLPTSKVILPELKEMITRLLS